MYKKYFITVHVLVCYASTIKLSFFFWGGGAQQPPLGQGTQNKMGNTHSLPSQYELPHPDQILGDLYKSLLAF